MKNICVTGVGSKKNVGSLQECSGEYRVFPECTYQNLHVMIIGALVALYIY